MKKILLILIFGILFTGCEFKKGIEIANLTSRGTIAEISCDGHYLYRYNGTGEINTLKELNSAFKSNQRRTYELPPQQFKPGDSLNWNFVFYHNNIEEGFGYPERVEVSLSSVDYFGSGDWIYLEDDTEVYSKNEMGISYLSDLLGGKEITVTLYNDTSFSCKNFMISGESVDDEKGQDRLIAKGTWTISYNSSSGRVKILSFDVENEEQSQRVRLFQPQWLGESIKVTISPTTAVVKVNEQGEDISEKCTLQSLF